MKTALKLLLVFVDYTEPNTLLLIQAVRAVDDQRGQSPQAAPYHGQGVRVRLHAYV